MLNEMLRELGHCVVNSSSERGRGQRSGCSVESECKRRGDGSDSVESVRLLRMVA
jgi:hypothetical protein